MPIGISLRLLGEHLIDGALQLKALEPPGIRFKGAEITLPIRDLGRSLNQDVTLGAEGGSDPASVLAELRRLEAPVGPHWLKDTDEIPVRTLRIRLKFTADGGAA